MAGGTDAVSATTETSDSRLSISATRSSSRPVVKVTTVVPRPTASSIDANTPLTWSAM